MHVFSSILYNLDVSKACGFDNIISNKILKLCAKGMYEPLTRFINLSLSTGKE
jgi:hypothetical protein